MSEILDKVRAKLVSGQQIFRSSTVTKLWRAAEAAETAKHEHDDEWAGLLNQRDQRIAQLELLLRQTRVWEDLWKCKAKELYGTVVYDDEYQIDLMNELAQLESEKAALAEAVHILWKNYANETPMIPLDELEKVNNALRTAEAANA